MIDDQSVSKAKPGMDVVDHRATGAEGVGRDPVGGPRIAIGRVLGEVHAEILGAAGQHAPHVSGLGSAELAEGGVLEAAVRRVLPGHRLAVVAVERLVQLPDHAWRCRPRSQRYPVDGPPGARASILGALGAWRSLVARTVRVGEVPGSNPGAPISQLGGRIRNLRTAGLASVPPAPTALTWSLCLPGRSFGVVRGEVQAVKLALVELALEASQRDRWR